jgi:hypothetical protein
MGHDDEPTSLPFDYSWNKFVDGTFTNSPDWDLVSCKDVLELDTFDEHLLLAIEQKFHLEISNGCIIMSLPADKNRLHAVRLLGYGLQ